MIWGDSQDMAGHLLDDGSADRLLGGAVHPDDAPPGFEGVARLLAMAASSPADVEPATADATVARMVAVIGETGPPGAPRSGKIRRLLTAKLAAAAGAVVLSTGAAAAATGSLPAPLQDAVAESVSHIGLDLPGSAPDQAGGTGKPDDRPGRAGGGGTGRADEPGGEGKATGRPDGTGPDGKAKAHGRDPGSRTADRVQDELHDADGPRGPEIAPCRSEGRSRAGEAEAGGPEAEVDCPDMPGPDAPSGPDPAGGAGQPPDKPGGGGGTSGPDQGGSQNPPPDRAGGPEPVPGVSPDAR